MRLSAAFRRNRLGILVAGDIIAFVAWAALGLAGHQLTRNWLFNLVRVVAPFVIGWLAVAPFTGAYRAALSRRPRAFLTRSALTWLGGISLGLLLRATLFRSGFGPIFALVTFAVTGVLVLGWRALYTKVLSSELGCLNSELKT